MKMRLLGSIENTIKHEGGFTVRLMPGQYQYASEIAESWFKNGPLTEKTFYHRNCYSPIQSDHQPLFPVYAGYTVELDDGIGHVTDPMLVCLSPNAKLVENYLFGLRRYECLHTFYSQRYGGSHYTYMGSTGAFAEIRYHLFNSEEMYDDFLVDLPSMNFFTFTNNKPKIDPNFWMPLPGNNKLRLPKIIEDIIIDDRNTLESRLQDAIQTLKYMLLITNFENERFPLADRAKGIERAKNKLAANIFYTTAYLSDYYNFLQARREKSDYVGDTDPEVLDQIRKNIMSRSPILFYNEKEYRRMVKSRIQRIEMDGEFHSIVGFDSHDWRF